MNSGPTKLCATFEAATSVENPVYPSQGRITCLPKRMMTPLAASRMKVAAIVQWAVRSTGLKRSMSRPVGLPRSRIGPLARWKSRIAAGTRTRSQPP